MPDAAGRPYLDETIGAAYPPARTATTTSVIASTAAVTLLAASAVGVQRCGVTISNLGSGVLYVLLGAGAVSPTFFTYALDAKGSAVIPAQVEIPADFVGLITGVWSATGGNALVTERIAP